MKKAALVLSGGGALGAAHIGVVQALEEKEYAFDFLAGVSAGSMIAGILACGHNSAAAKTLTKKANIFKGLFDFSPSNFGVLKGKNIIKILETFYEGRRIEDLDIPLYIGATDFETGERIMINTGKIADAVRASISVPAIFEPYFHPELKRWLVDGGLTQNFPLDTAVQEYTGATIIGSDVASTLSQTLDFNDKKLFKKPARLTRALFQTFRIIFKSQQEHFKEDTRVTTITPNLEGFTSFNIFDVDPIIKQGYIAASDAGL